MLNTYTKLLKKPISGFADLNLLLSAVMDSSTRTTVCESIFIAGAIIRILHLLR